MQNEFVISYAAYFTILRRQTEGLMTLSLSAQERLLQPPLLRFPQAILMSLIAHLIGNQ